MARTARTVPLPATLDDLPSWAESVGRPPPVDLDTPLAGGLTRAAPELLPTARILADLKETDEVPQEFAFGSPAEAEAVDHLAVVLGDRPLQNVAFDLQPIPFKANRVSAEGWLRALLLECQRRSPGSTSGVMVSWIKEAFSLEAPPSLLWGVPPRLRHYDSCLAHKLSSMIKAEGGHVLSRRVVHLETEALAIGRSVPARKLISMICWALTRDSSTSEEVALQEWCDSIWMSGTSLESAAAFLLSVEEFIARSPPVITAAILQARVVAELGRVKDSRLSINLRSFGRLHPLDPQRNFRFFKPIVQSLLEEDRRAAMKRVDLGAPRPPPPKTPATPAIKGGGKGADGAKDGKAGAGKDGAGKAKGGGKDGGGKHGQDGASKAASPPAVKPLVTVTVDCWTCGASHFARDCPQKGSGKGADAGLSAKAKGKGADKGAKGGGKGKADGAQDAKGGGRGKGAGAKDGAKAAPKKAAPVTPAIPKSGSALTADAVAALPSVASGTRAPGSVHSDASGSSSASAVPPDSYLCVKCNQAGHYVRNCPIKRSGGSLPKAAASMPCRHGAACVMYAAGTCRFLHCHSPAVKRRGR